MSVKGPLRSAGICQRYDDFSKLDDMSYAALTTGIKNNELGYTLLKQGELVNGPAFQHEPHQSGMAYGVDPRTGKLVPVPVPHPEEKLRDDLQHTRRNAPRPY
ncbi:hypothetical protein [Candidatus Berkiella aquae]|uniref:Uncharacterized protein n=1 Tax=Candidatus Berkiella aquae TaxID=295108 RepID=A0A0Q9YQ16_9GAMM|nr:hypothetical protein [Candidatus Berkiella aquae]MCS5711755.1 hypothetical protein [Candidatus Berkiella aquae]